MKAKKLAIAVTSAALVAAVTIGGSLAYFTDSDANSNVITMGHVSGTLTETQEQTRTDGTKGLDFTNLVPGQTIQKDPTVTIDRNSEDAYVRVKIDYTGLTDQQISDLKQGITLSKDWVTGTDGYIYYNNIMKANDKSKLFSEVTIPATWGNEVTDKTFNMNITAEMIQADNFTPTKDASGNINGWNGVTVENYTAPAVG